MTALGFEVHHRCTKSRARSGRCQTPHGDFQTPAFMTVGTKGTVKGIPTPLLRGVGAEVVLNNTYHLLLRPGADAVGRRGGAHRFMQWNGPILTDSGGFQAYSMADINAVDDDGVSFKSIVDGSMLRMTPESSMAAQNAIGADIIMAFDDCPPSIDPVASSQTRLRHATARDRKAGVMSHNDRLRIANERTVRWLERCVNAHHRPAEQALFGIVQGGTDPERRAWCAERVGQFDLPGFAIGGVAVGEQPGEIERVVRTTAPLLPDNRPRYLMGVGYPRDIVSAVLSGVDMFDCVLPTRNGRNMSAFVPGGQIRLKNAVHAEDDGPIEPGCDCPACSPDACGWPAVATDGGPGHYSRAYLRHLFMADEMLGPILVTLHNLRLYQRLMSDLRRTIADGDWAGFRGRWPSAACVALDDAAGLSVSPERTE